jgi:hypothetical protein
VWTPSALYYTHFANAASFINQGRLYVVGGLDIFNSTIERVYMNTLTVSPSLRISHGVFTGEVFDLGVNRQVDTLSIPYITRAMRNFTTAQLKTAEPGATGCW